MDVDMKTKEDIEEKGTLYLTGTETETGTATATVAATEETAVVIAGENLAEATEQQEGQEITGSLMVNVVSAPVAALAPALEDVPHLRAVGLGVRGLAPVREPVRGRGLGAVNVSLQMPLPARSVVP
jgi:hypothetical protein